VTETPNICLVIPVFNHALTLGQVARAAKAHFPLIVVNDGSSDGAAAILAGASDIDVVTFPRNLGKGAALRSGFARARTLGFTHAISLDADGQHSAAEIPRFAAACRARPEALVIGVRDLAKERAPRRRRVSNWLSSFWFRVETGLSLVDTQCGYRAYPLAAIRRLDARGQRYGYELDVMVKAAWAGVPLFPLAVSADYLLPTSRLSHFRPWRDFALISLLHLRLSAQAWRLWPRPRLFAVPAST